MASNRRRLGTIKDTERFSQLEVWDELFGYCMKCGYIGKLNRYDLERKYGRNAHIQPLKFKLRCTVCKNKQSNMIGVRNKLRD